jgi:CRISPR type III-associated protein (TIGR04423 family)
MIQSISIDELKGLEDSFEGYYWLSDATQPWVYLEPTSLRETDLLARLESPLPFVIEAGLWDRVNRVSLAIKQVDDRSIITRVDLKAMEEAAKKKYAFIERNHLSILKEDAPADPEKPRRHPIRLYELWQETSGGPNLAGFPVLTPSLTVFGGFLPLLQHRY